MRRVGEPLERESLASLDEHVRAAVGEHAHVAQLGDAAHAPRGKGALGPTRRQDDPEAAVARAAVREQLAIAGLEDVQRERRAGEENQRERKERERVRRHVRKLTPHAPRVAQRPATSATTARRSARANGLIRTGQTDRLRNAAASAETVSPLEKMIRRSTSGRSRASRS